MALVNDISTFIRSYKSKIDVDPEQTEGIRERLGAINLLKKKYGGSIKAVLDLRAKIHGELELAENFSGRIDELNNALYKIRTEGGKLAKEISTKRKEESKKVKNGIESSLRDLGISNPNFQTEISNDSAESKSFIIADGKNYKYTSKGIDKVEFFISTNKGEDPKPLVKVASGGEISRIMLSLKSTLAKSDKLPLLIFDEIDVGVSGRIAQKVGKVLKDLAGFHQIIAITHLPQIAGLADHHYSVNKIADGKRTVSSIAKLTDGERIKEIAKLMSGENITEASLKGAQELMGIK